MNHGNNGKYFFDQFRQCTKVHFGYCTKNTPKCTWSVQYNLCIFSILFSFFPNFHDFPHFSRNFPHPPIFLIFPDFSNFLPFFSKFHDFCQISLVGLKLFLFSRRTRGKQIRTRKQPLDYIIFVISHHKLDNKGIPLASQFQKDKIE